MSQETIQEILSKVSTLKLSDFQNLQQQQIRILEQRSDSFITAIKNSDLNKVKELIDLELNFQDKRLLHKLYDLSLSSINKETINYLLNLELKLKPISTDLIHGFLECKKELNPHRASEIDPLIVFKYFIKTGLKRTLEHYKFTDEVFELARSHIEPQMFFELAKKHAVGHLATFENMGSYTNAHNYIKNYPNELIPILVNNIKSEENLNSFLNNKTYKDFLENSIKNDKDGQLMIGAVGNGSYSKMVTLNKMGVCFPLSKEPYSKLFAKTDPLISDAQKYVINNIEDITIGNQVILKTLLHAYRFQDANEKTEIRKGLITLVLNRYTKEQLEILPEALKKREPSELVNLVGKYYDYVSLSKEVEASSEINTSGITSKKPKI